MEIIVHHFPRVRVIHWHGVNPAGRDHSSLLHYPRARARRLLEVLMAIPFEGVLTLEVFRPEDFEESMEVYRTLIEELRP
jgi:hypothetical protein